MITFRTMLNKQSRLRLVNDAPAGVAHASREADKLYRKCNTMRFAMKTATIPALRVEPELRKAAEEVLNENESLSSFMEASLRESIAKRRLQREFVARG